MIIVQYVCLKNKMDCLMNRCTLPMTFLMARRYACVLNVMSWLNNARCPRATTNSLSRYLNLTPVTGSLQNACKDNFICVNPTLCQDRCWDTKPTYLSYVVIIILRAIISQLQFFSWSQENQTKADPPNGNGGVYWNVFRKYM